MNLQQRVETLRQDGRLSLRLMRRSPLFCWAAIGQHRLRPAGTVSLPDQRTVAQRVWRRCTDGYQYCRCRGLDANAAFRQTPIGTDAAPGLGELSARLLKLLAKFLQLPPNVAHLVLQFGHSLFEHDDAFVHW